MSTCLDCGQQLKSKKALRCLPCYWKTTKGRKISNEHKQKISKAQKGRKHLPQQGYQKGHGLLGNNNTCKGKTWKWSEKSKENFSKNYRGEKHHSTGKPMSDKLKEIFKGRIGEKSPVYIKDRTKLKKSPKKHLDSAYKEWMLNVKNRDNWKCFLSNNECHGNLEVYHILNWVQYQDERYKIDNGITLCKFHHPRGREKETLMIPIFKDIINKIQN